MHVRRALAVLPLLVGTALARNLVVVNAVGRLETIGHVARNVETHFSDGSWQCVVMAWANAAAAKHALRATKCELYFSPRARWGQFLAMLRPVLVQPYEHITILLDDIFVPTSGPFPVNVTGLLREMHRHSLGGISPVRALLAHPWLEASWEQPRRGGLILSSYPPLRRARPLAPQAVFGAHPRPMLQLKTRCLRRVHALEIFFTIYTRAAWLCMVGMFDAADSNLGGCGYDFCFPRVCPQFRLAVDDRSAVHHMERSPPERYIVRTLSPADRAGLQAAPTAGGGARAIIPHTDNPCADADFSGIAGRHGCNYSAAFIAWDPADPEWAIACGSQQ